MSSCQVLLHSYDAFSWSQSKRYAEVKIGGHSLDHKQIFHKRKFNSQCSGSREIIHYRSSRAYAFVPPKPLIYASTKIGGHELDHVPFIHRGKPSGPILLLTELACDQSADAHKCGITSQIVESAFPSVKLCCRNGKSHKISSMTNKKHKCAEKSAGFSNPATINHNDEKGLDPFGMLTLTASSFRMCLLLKQWLGASADSNRSISSSREPWRRRIATASNSSKLLQFDYIRLLGDGQSGTVFLMCRKDKKYGSFVVLKESDKLALAENEMQLLNRIHSPHIVHVYDFFREEIGHQTLAYMEMEYCDGGDLHQYIVKNGALKPESFLEIFCQICIGLRDIHKAGVMHCDLKPSNILLTASKIVKIADFGVSKQLNQTVTYHPAGTLAYMAPEVRQFLFNSEVSFDFRADIWSLGAIGIAMITGDPEPRIAIRPVEEIASSLDKFGFPKKIVQVVLQMLVKVPKNRFSRLDLVRDICYLMDFSKCYSILESQQREAAQDDSRSNCCAHIGDRGSVCPGSEDYMQGTPRDLARHFLKQQENRSLSYSKFHRGFKDPATEFSTFCAIMTQEFAAISKEINEIEKALREQQQSEMAQLIRSIQVAEKEKLFLTSALFLEKTRLRSERMKRVRDGQEDSESVTIPLLEKSIDRISEKHTHIISEINELLETFQSELNELF
ncbi:unnamed protein product [Albugo candida]|uniref:Protein kinase domain-containing protein n=3 Tax=Albugo candida TaxID=65357 RepID=A0A024G1B5_9STRA|nr:unnamed protein product [Albugo candida]|eukprot:CCI40425.1 unnamed protein product [Albugo candida]